MISIVGVALIATGLIHLSYVTAVLMFSKTPLSASKVGTVYAASLAMIALGAQLLRVLL